MTATGRRGSYAKGVARRKEILRAALAAYSLREGPEPSLKQIADAVGLTEAGLLHYFGSKDELLVAVLEERDDVAREQFDQMTWDGVRAALERVYDTPGQVRLFVDMSVAAASPDHPAHAFMLRRTEFMIERLKGLLGTEDESLPRAIIAAAEGLQIQWLRDRSIDVAGEMQRLLERIRPVTTAPAKTSPAKPAKTLPAKT